MKNKKFLVIIITILLCFTMFQRPKRVEAFDFVITPAVLWVLGSLVVATGVVAINHEQVLDMGQMVADKIEDFKDIANETKIKLTGKVLSAILQVALSLPTENKTVPKVFSGGLSTFYYDFYSKGYDVISKSDVETLYSLSTLDSFTISATGDELVEVGIQSKYKSVRIGESITFKFIYAKVGQIYYNGVISYNHNTGVYDNITTFTEPLTSTDRYKVSFPAKYLSESSISADIPYSNPLVRENYFPDVLPNNVPVNEKDRQGVVSIPAFLPDVSISADNPYDWDVAKDIIGYDVIPGDSTIPDVSVDDGIIEDVPGTDIPEGLSLWGWLKALLMAVLNMLKSLFDAVKGFFTQIFDFFRELFATMYDFFEQIFGNLIKVFTDIFTNLFDLIGGLVSSLLAGLLGLLTSLIDVLVSAISKAIEFLFVPTVSITDLFDNLSDTGFGQIDELVDFSSMLEVGQEPFRFNEVLTFDTIVDTVEYPLNIDFSDFKFLNENINLVRNLLSYPLLLGSLWFVIRNLLPQRVVD